MSGHTRSSQEPPFALKTDLQRRRDNYGFKVQKKWPTQGERPNLDPRVFAADDPYNYQYVVHQALMHTPIFVNWILSHNSPYVLDQDGANCMMCMYKRMAQEYSLNNGPESLGAQQAISDVAFAIDAACFPHHASGDAAVFYEWVVDQMKWDVPDEPTTSAESWKTVWNEEHAALFDFEMEKTEMCQRCTMTTTTQGPMSMLEVQTFSGDIDLVQILRDNWWECIRDFHCNSCNTQTSHEIDISIVAAP